MFKLSLVLLLVCSAFFCRASPVDSVNSNINGSLGHPPSNASGTIVSADSSLKGNETAKVEQPPSNKIVPPSDSPIQNDKSSSTSTTTTSTTSTTSTTLKPDTTSSTTSTTSQKPDTTSPTTSTTTQKPGPTPTTHKPVPPSTLPPPVPPTTDHPKPSPDGGFNLISFLGGMILGLGLLAIGYVVFKFYQTRRDSSYRTL